MAKRERESANVRLGLNVRALREHRGWNQPDLAAAMKDRGHPWHPQTVVKVEAGDQPVRWHEAESLAAIFGTTLDRLARNVGEANAADFLYARGAAVRRAGEGVAGAVMRLLIDLATAQSAADQTAGDERKLVVEARADLLGAMEEWDLDEAVAEGESRYDRRQEEA